MIDRNQVVLMADTGFTRREIAKRVGCSEKQVRRIIKAHEQENNVQIKPQRGLTDKEIENAQRAYYLVFEPAEKVAARFGISRQAIYKGNL